jgi:hypothetical protein
MIRRHTLLCTLASTAFLGSLLGSPSGLAAQEVGQRRPQLGGHSFISNTATRDPFPRTFLLTSMGVGKTMNLVLVPSFQIGDRVVEEVQGNLLFADLDLTYQYRVQDWLGVWGRVNIAGRLGTTTGALLAEGITTVTGFELGWLFRLVETSNVVLSGTANLWNDSFVDVDVVRWAEGLVGGEAQPLVTSSPTVRGGGGLRLAWGINEGWGILMSGEGGYGESPDPEAGSAWVTDVAAGVSLDLRAYTDVALGFALTGSTRGFDRQGAKPENRASEIGLRTAYTGRDDFLVGLDTRLTGYKSADGDNVGVIRVALTMQYYF